MIQILSEVVPTVLVANPPGCLNGITEPAVYRCTDGEWRDATGRRTTDLMAEKLSDCWEQQALSVARDQQLAALRDLFLTAVALPAAAVETLACVARSFLQDSEQEEV